MRARASGSNRPTHVRVQSPRSVHPSHRHASRSSLICIRNYPLPLFITYHSSTNAVYSRLDAPASLDPSIRSQLEHLSSSYVGWNTLSGILGSLTKVLTIASQISVLLAVFRNERGGREFFLLALIQPAMLFLGQEEEGPMPQGGGESGSSIGSSRL